MRRAIGVDLGGSHVMAAAVDEQGELGARHEQDIDDRAPAAVFAAVEKVIAGALGDGYGHVELVYDFARGGAGDGWLHALFRYRHRDSGHAAETSFGAHVFNTLFIYRDEKYNPDTDKKGVADIIVAKHRNGPVGEVVLAFRKEYPKFMNYAGDRFAA